MTTRTADEPTSTAAEPADQARLDQLADDYRRNGFVLIPGLLTAEEAASYRQTSHDLLARLNRPDDPTWASASEVSMGQATSLKHLHDAQFYDAAYSRLLTDPRFTKVAAAVLGTPNVQLHHTKLFVKPPENGSPFPLHQDHPFFPHTHNRVAAAIFHFDDAPEEKGCVRVIPGSHADGPREHDPTGSFHLPDVPFDDAIPQPAKAGDVLFFSCLTVHGSGVNVSDEARTTWLVQFRDPADPPLTDAHNHSLGQGMMLTGIDPTGRQAAR
ncbi:phytanoyl-CoA dioxygenase family protein [Microlunatus soli]|uniref:Ectoine hydroxylase-related dioxygenase, phytanoyl-CoA dioxygenase (PhyH) family n=1 Tax=Microlunatus soli TaxID=630515 RepID=A0A1H1VPS4_9ACTN|nr:phytanoyl-CoA dioxygenase family protein [Microlunatus soli]SDS86276.1 Ectoine hydroxylase-related dioxygenase, phytanoyl-CoA dioxygenase (PhyH) family [Microlunatus soli]